MSILQAVCWKAAVFAVISCMMLLLTVSAQSSQKLHKLARKDGDGLAQLSLDAFMQNIISEDKDYSVVVQLTALDPKYKCGPCITLDKSLRAVSRGWKKHGDGSKKNSRLVFGSLDIKDGEDMFRKMGIESLPRLMVFPASSGPAAIKDPRPRELGLSTDALRPENMANKLGSLLKADLKADVPVDYSKYTHKIMTAIAGIYAVYLVYKFINLRMLGRNIWAIATIMFVLLMTSGFMWCRINDPPYMGQANSGDAVLFAPSNNQQYAVELQIVAVTYAVCALCVVVLVKHTPQIQNQDHRTSMTFLFVFALALSYSYLYSIFRMKMQGYPFRLLLD